MNRFKMFLQLTFFLKEHAHRDGSFSTFFNMNWFSIIFQIDFFRKIIVTILSCFLTSCHHENDWHVFPKCLLYKNLNHKLGNCVTYYLNEQIQDVFTTHFLFERACSERWIFFNFFWYELVQYNLPNWLLQKNHSTILSCFVISCPH